MHKWVKKKVSSIGLLRNKKTSPPSTQTPIPLIVALPHCSRVCLRKHDFRLSRADLRSVGGILPPRDIRRSPLRIFMKIGSLIFFFSQIPRG